MWKNRHLTDEQTSFVIISFARGRRVGFIRFVVVKVVWSRRSTAHMRRICQLHSGTGYYLKIQCCHSWNAEFPYISSWITMWWVEAFFLKLYFLRFFAVLGAGFKEMLGKTAYKHEVEHKSWKNAATGEIENHQKNPIEMAFWVWWHLSENFVFAEPEEFNLWSWQCKLRRSNDRRSGRRPKYTRASRMP